MGTVNYAYENILYSCDNDDNDDFLADDIINNIVADLTNFYLTKKEFILSEVNEVSPHFLRSFYRRRFFDISKEIDDEYISIYLTITEGYSYGFNFDFDIVYNDRHPDYPEDEYIKLSEVKNLNLLPEELSFIEETKKVIEETYSKYVTPLEHIGTLSNGEGVYKIS